MKIRSMLPIPVMVFACSAAASASGGGSASTRGGGDEVGLEFQRAAAKAVASLRVGVGGVDRARLEALLESARYVVPRKLDAISFRGAGQEGVAVNDRATGTIYIHRARWKALPEASRERIALHELLSLMGLEGTGDYHISATVETVAGHRPDPVLLLEREYHAGSQGLDWESAVRACGNAKGRYAGRYFFVYCSYLEKRVQAWPSYPEHDFRYGLRVHGLGERRADAPWITVFQGPSFATESEAREACIMTIAESSALEPMWRDPRCEVIGSGGRYAYEIQTQNPLAQ